MLPSSQQLPSPRQATELSRRRPKNLSDGERRADYEQLLEMSVEGELPRGAFQCAAQRFGCSRLTIARVWKRGRASIKEGLAAADTSSKIKGNSGRKCTRSSAAIEEAIKAVSHLNRQTLRTLAVKASIPKTTILRHMKQNPRLKARSNYVKPMLTEDNKLERLKFAMSFPRPSSSGSHFFDNMYSYVHVDEKWLYLTKVRRKFYVYDDEDVAVRSVKSKGFITKVMFLAAVAKPRYDYHERRMFDGKLGVWPFVESVPAKRTIKNRPKGTIETVHQSVNASVYQKTIMEKVIPAIRQKFPQNAQEIILQQDNAGPHRPLTTEVLRLNDISNVLVTNQPPNSPDFNVLA
ncbi:hypothetical protein Ae201684P_011923 [Aphanomyces euteiches]|uniref:DUF7769 domain-containing protein n=1 Tax=Aphanomyces euteiches TaxID=100861 RepID=A0A6G0WUP2_9STRA|nr:hypothetical protein Ae201684_011442 [Aphanomyces euteiches]KAH9097199.1 hypothetical protein Ae201684P_011923 [Aphanomyces euteiches]KAH9134660.1 hypothetical protein AeRB84_019628 [Aphanomyces euteiches]